MIFSVFGWASFVSWFPFLILIYFYRQRKRGYLIVDDLDYSSTSEDDFAVSSQQGKL